jgi:hypothetical protein
VQTASALLAVGFAQWRLGRLEAADETMRKAMNMMKAHLPADSKPVLLAMRQYRNYLRGVHRDREAEAIERDLLAARSLEPVCPNCINVRSLSNTLR